MEPWTTERKLEALASRFYKEQHRVNASLLREDTTLLETLREDYRALADYHHDRFNPQERYHYYTI